VTAREPLLLQQPIQLEIAFEPEPVRCLFCGAPELVQLAEVWGHEFQIETCCWGLHEHLAQEMALNTEWGKELLRNLELEPLTGRALRRVVDGGGHALLDFKLKIASIKQAEAKEFVLRHHKHCPPPAGWRFGAGIWNGGTLMGVVMVGRPVARRIDHRFVVEANRVCVRRDTAAPLRWNACSQLYGWVAREAERRGFKKIITYTLESEVGTTLRAAGWTCEGPAGGGSWDRKNRRREGTGPRGRKLRWSRTLRPRLGPVDAIAG